MLWLKLLGILIIILVIALALWLVLEIKYNNMEHDDENL